jgi:hypothetical protein
VEVDRREDRALRSRSIRHLAGVARARHAHEQIEPIGSSVEADAIGSTPTCTPPTATPE